MHFWSCRPYTATTTSTPHLCLRPGRRSWHSTCPSAWDASYPFRFPCPDPPPFLPSFIHPSLVSLQTFSPALYLPYSIPTHPFSHSVPFPPDSIPIPPISVCFPPSPIYYCRLYYPYMLYMVFLLFCFFLKFSPSEMCGAILRTHSRWSHFLHATLLEHPFRVTPRYPVLPMIPRFR